MNTHPHFPLFHKIPAMLSCFVLMAGMCSAQVALPILFPINMGFKTFDSYSDNSTANNEAFDSWNSSNGTHSGNLTTADRFPVHHGGFTNMKKIENAYPMATPPIITIDTTVASRALPTGSNSTAVGTVFRGHYLYYAGTYARGNIPYATSGNLTTIPVGNATVFVNNAKDADGNPFPDMNDHVIIYTRDTYLNPNWADSEYAQLTSYDTVNNTITIRRGTSGSTPHAFNQNPTTGLYAYIAPHVAGWEVGNNSTSSTQNFRINYSLHAPVDPGTTKRAYEWAAMLVANEMNNTTNGAINLDGIEHDESVNSFYATDIRSIDVNNDGLPDHGYINGINSYGLGLQQYAKLLRNGVQSQWTGVGTKIIQFDSDYPETGYRGWECVNGAQLETFMGGKRFSEAYEHLSHWVKNATAAPKFSYGYCRTATRLYHGANVTYSENSEFRKQFAVGLMLGMPHPYGSKKAFGMFDWDEEHGGLLGDYHWLGKVTGANGINTPAKREECLKANGTAEDDLLVGSTWKVKVAAGYGAQDRGAQPFASPSPTPGAVYGSNSTTSLGARDSLGWHSLEITTIPANTKPDEDGVVLQLDAHPNLGNLDQGAANVVGDGKEYTLTFQARATDSYTGSVTDPVSHAITSYTFSNTPSLIHVYGFGGYKAWVLADQIWRTYTLSFEATNYPTNITFGISETKGIVQIKNITFQKGTTDRLSREFEHGKVFLNMSKDPWTISSNSTMYPTGYSYLSGNQTNPVDAGGGAANTTNSGSPVPPTGNFTVNPNDAVFLCK